MYLAIDEMLHSQQPRSLVMERRWKSNIEIAPNCPRCASPNTKFCYYNNYSLSQPRYFCKGCRRYWTKGGSLRNIPTGGSCRQSRRTKVVRLAPSGESSDDGSERAISGPSIVGTPGAPSMEPCIDMTSIFAKFVNRTENTNSSSDIIGSINQDICLEDIFADIQTQSYTSEDREQNFTEFPNSDHILQEVQTHEFLEHDPNCLIGLQTILSDEPEQERMWSDTTISTNFSWPSMGKLQKFGSYCDDQPELSTHIGENWNMFDLPDINSRPSL